MNSKNRTVDRQCGKKLGRRTVVTRLVRTGNAPSEACGCPKEREVRFYSFVALKQVASPYGFLDRLLYRPMFGWGAPIKGCSTSTLLGCHFFFSFELPYLKASQKAHLAKDLNAY
jgi:hypothetical protein